MKHEHIILSVACFIVLIFFCTLIAFTLLINLLIKNIWISIAVTIPTAYILFNLICKIIDKRNERKFKKDILQ